MKIEGIDYSRPGYKEMFANYGLTAIAALSLEKAIWLLITAIDNLGKGHIGKDEIQERLKKHKRKPMGELIKELHKRIIIKNELTADLKDALEKRNFIIHHFFTEKVDNIRNSPQSLSNELRPVRDFFSSVHEQIDEILAKVIEQMNVPLDKISDEVKKMLKGEAT